MKKEIIIRDGKPWTVHRPTYTNKAGLSAPLVTALIGSPEIYTTDGRISVTKLIDDPMSYQLHKRCAADKTVDVSDLGNMLLGTGFHAAIEHAHKRAVDKTEAELMEEFGMSWELARKLKVPAFLEERLECEIDGWQLVGYADYFNEDGDLADFKTASSYVYSFGKGKAKIEWERQLNVYAYMWRMHGYKVKRATVEAFFKDWSRIRAKHDRNHPKYQMMELPARLWSHEEAEAYIQERIALHKQWDGVSLELIPECAPEQRWKKETSYAVRKGTNKTASKVFWASQHGGENKALEAADAWIAQKQEQGHKDAGKFWLEERPGEDTRCLHFCDYAKFCPYGSQLGEAPERTPVELGTKAA